MSIYTHFAVCPSNQDHDEFITSAVVVEDWVVSATGDWLRTAGCTDVFDAPSLDNEWTCAICGATAEFKRDDEE